MPIDLSKVTLVSGESETQDEGTEQLFHQATAFITSFSWCTAIDRAYAGITIPGVIGVFLFEITPSSPEVDEWLWVLVGDIPPAYLVVDQATNPACAIRRYIDEMTAWVRAANAGEPVDDLIPVNVAATVANAEALDRRLNLLRSEVLVHWEDDLRACDE